MVDSATQTVSPRSVSRAAMSFARVFLFVSKEGHVRLRGLLDSRWRHISTSILCHSFASLFDDAEFQRLIR